MFEINKRIRELRKELKLTQSKFGEKLNVSRSVISNIEYDNVDVETNQLLLNSIIYTYGVNENWLRTGEGKMFSETRESYVDELCRRLNLPEFGKRALLAYLDLSSEEQAAVEKYINAIISGTQNSDTEEDESERYIEISYTDARVSAGFGDELEDYENWEKVSVPLTPESKKADFILRVDGDSMEPQYHDNDYILVRKQPAVDEGQIGVFGHGGRGYVKKFGGDRLISLNSKYPDIPTNEDTKCFGLVLGLTAIK